MRLLTMQRRLYATPTGRLERLYNRLCPEGPAPPTDYRIVRNVVCAMILCILEERQLYLVTDN